MSVVRSIIDPLFRVFNDWAFWVFALTTIAAAIAVVVSQNVVRMAFWLIISLGATAGLFFSLDADFVGSAQLLIYVGGTLVLLIFGVMLTASGPFVKIKTSPGEGVLAALIGVLLLSLILYSACAVDWSQNENYDLQGRVASGFNVPAEGNTTHTLGLSLLSARPDKDLGSTTASLTSGYLLPFEIVSVHLLVVLVGASYLARAKRRKEPAAPQSSA
ncbi:MAG TPA: NADH-quinone oxidoreductase subunit J [Planctomycetaceae bacterium]|nr:NADH-quinone oxidoreductase subunit J [Planctomycetaceae bacterium]